MSFEPFDCDQCGHSLVECVYCGRQDQPPHQAYPRRLERAERRADEAASAERARIIAAVERKIAEQCMEARVAVQDGLLNSAAAWNRRASYWQEVVDFLKEEP